MAAEKRVKWFDLGRYGAALRLIPKSPLRGVAITCLEINDPVLFERAHGYVDGQSGEERAPVADRFQQALRDFGFSAHPQSVVRPGNPEMGEEERTLRRTFSTKTEFTLSELRRLVPSIEASDLREMPVNEIVLAPEIDPQLVGEWQVFAASVLSNEALAVWTPRTSPFDRAYDDAALINAVRAAKSVQPHALMRGNSVSAFSGVAGLLERANYRENALIPFYVDQRSAVADGWNAEDVIEVDLPYALPLWVTAQGQIVALRDIRHAPEIMELAPERYYARCDAGLVVPMLREAPAVAALIVPELVKWQGWSASPETLDAPEALWESINSVVMAVEAFEQRHARVRSGVSRLLAGAQWEPEVPARAKPLGEWTDADSHSLAATVAAFTAAPLAEAVAALGGATRSAETLLQAQATEVARRKLSELAASVQADLTGDGASARHEDAGAKIGGARKDYARRALMVEDLESMNAMERKALVVKKNVWPPLDYKKMREEGVSPEAATAIKYLKDTLSVAPGGRAGEDGPHEDYIRAIGAVRDRMATVKTLDEVAGALRDLYALGSAGANHDGRKTITGGSLYQTAWGSKASWLIYEGEDGRLPRKLAHEVRRKVGRYDDDATEDQRWSSLIKVKREKSEMQVEEERSQADVERELHRPHLDRVERAGAEWRGGRDITAEDLIERFGFRAVEFGNWLPQDERQQVLNMAFDSFCDLAQALDIPPEGVSLDGDLAVAFGSRGRGGRGAALAHYEPMRNVINLTRMKGAGVLAHEWMHGLDWHLGGHRAYASESEGEKPSPMGKLSRAMHVRAAMPDELESYTSANVKRASDNAKSWCYQQPSDARQRIAVKFDELRGKAEATFYASTVRHVEATKANPRFSEAGIPFRGAVDYDAMNHASVEMMEAIKALSPVRPAYTKVKDKIEQNIDYMLRNLAVNVAVVACREQGVSPPESLLTGSNSAHTGFFANAKKLDTMRSSPYWATTRELFARAGAAYVQDQIEARNERSDYLVYGSDESRHAEHPVGNPNPTGRDRTALASHFDALMAEYRLHCVKQADVGFEP